MAEYTANDLQNVLPNQAILYSETAVNGNQSIMHREGSGLVTLRGLTCQRRARFRASFGANIALPTGGTAGPISVAFAVNGEPDISTSMIVTPAAVGEFFNVSRSFTIDVPAGCCAQLSVENISGTAIDAQNVNLIVERMA